MKPPRIHILQHVPFEDEANIGAWAGERGHATSKTLLYNGAALPALDSFDHLLILGGPMSVNDRSQFPWLTEEVEFIQAAIAGGKTVLGICLGAQLIAQALGARIYKNPYKEIGWYSVSLTDEAKSSPVFRELPQKFTPFHWHGETFDLPAGCVRMAQSDACANQAFEYESRVVGLQFHLESSGASVERLIQNCPEDLAPGKFVQSDRAVLTDASKLAAIRVLMDKFLAKAMGVLVILLLSCASAIAAPTSEETAAFFAVQRSQKADFDQDILEETDSRTAALQVFNAKAQTDRAAFIRSLSAEAPQERTQRMSEYNAAALQAKKAFQQKLPTVSKGKLEKTLADFDKRSGNEARALAESLSGADPETRIEALRQFSNTVRQNRAKLLNDAQKDLRARKRKFQIEQDQKLREFVVS